MRTVTFKSVYESIARMHGMDPRGDAVSSDAGLSISDNLNDRVRTAWFAWEWPEWTITEERAFRQIWNNSRQFYQVNADGEQDEVFYIPNVATQSLVGAAYYRVKTGASGNPPIGVPPTNATYWEPMTTVDTFVAYDQVCRRKIGEVLEVFANNPAVCKPPRCLNKRPSENGIQIYEAGGLSTVFVRYLIPAEQFTTFPYIASRTYLRGDTVYLASTGECYQAIVTAMGHDPATEFTYWRRCLFPAVLSQYVQLGTYADCLRESDTSDERDPVMLQIRGQRASQAASDAEDEINRQINRLQAQGQNFQYLPFGVRVARGGPAVGGFYSVPGYVLQGGGAYNYGPIAPTGSGATTISDQCETEWGYIPPPPPIIPPGPGEGIEVVSGITQLVSGQSYIDVPFLVPQDNANWIFVEYFVANTVDSSPLNIWPGLLTVKTTDGFQLQLNGTPDSGNYYLNWAITPRADSGGPAATTYQFSGPGSGKISTPATFTVQLPPATSVASPVTVTPGDGGAGGTFTPATVALTTAAPSATFTYTPASYGGKTISVTNDGGLTDPGVRSFTSVAGTYTLAGPSGGVTGVPSTNFTVALPAGGVVTATVTVMPGDGAGGTFTPTSVALTTVAPSATFTYTPATAGAKTISVTNNRGLTDPASLTYTATVPGLADGDPVSTWHDSSVNGNDATMTGSNRPTFKTNIVNGHPVVRFTSAASSKLNLTTPIAGTFPWIIFAVTKPATNTSRIDSLDGSDGGSPHGPFVVSGGSVYVFTREGYVQLTAPISFAWHVLDGIYGGVGSQFVLVDGAGSTNALTALANTGNFTTIGYDSVTPTYCDGDIAEIIIYNATLSGTDRANIEKYLGTKYGVTVAGGTAVQPDTVTGLKGWWKADSLG